MIGRFIVALVLFAVAGFCWLAFNSDENLLFAIGGGLSGLVGLFVLFSPLFKRRSNV